MHRYIIFEINGKDVYAGRHVYADEAGAHDP